MLAFSQGTCRAAKIYYKYIMQRGGDNIMRISISFRLIFGILLIARCFGLYDTCCDKQIIGSLCLAAIFLES